MGHPTLSEPEAQTRVPTSPKREPGFLPARSASEDPTSPKRKRGSYQPEAQARVLTSVGLYVHVPFCESKCGYCDFYSVVPGAGDCESLVDGLLLEMESAFRDREVRVETIFVGGGTPTSLPIGEMGRLFDSLGRIGREHAVAEFTVEANPASMDRAKADLLRRHGVTRISMGAQSFDPGELRLLDRRHQVEDIAPSVELVRQAGFDHLNLDLIFGIPGQTLSSWIDSLRRAVELGPDHLACYGLTYEPGTRLRLGLEAGLISLVPEVTETKMYLTAIDRLEAAGLAQYEISNFAQPGCECRHNLRYWFNEPTLGVGPSAAGYFEGRRWRNVADTSEYVRRIYADEPLAIESETLSPLERAGETAILQLRLAQGIPCGRFRGSTGFDPLQLFAEAIDPHVRHGLLVADQDHIALTRRGRLLANVVMVDFLAPGPP